MTAKATSSGKPDSAKPVRPTDLGHIRVSPPFKAKFARPCLICRQEVERGTEAALVENTRSHKKATAHEECVLEDAALLARRESAADLDGFLSA